jgi:DNA sulfur modification protein DndD
MHLRSIKLRDWKAYQEAHLEFPAPTKKKNVVLIGAMNGYGKTSLLEALVLGLFGRDGLSVLSRAVMADGETDRLAQSYDDFLSRALHAKAPEQGRTSASVEIMLEDQEDTLTIQRIWHFSGSRKHKREDEEVRIWRGVDRELVRRPRMEDKDDFIRNFVSQNFLPVPLSQFFLFDGEQVQRLARRDMSAQVRLGIEGILGVPILRELERDLQAYAQNRRNGVPKVGDETIERLRAEVKEIEARVRAADCELDALAPQLDPLKQQRDQLVRDLGSLHGGNYANLKELHEIQSKLERERDRVRERLGALMRQELALAISGRELRNDLATRLVAEDERAKWENGKQQSDGGLTKLMNAMSAPPPVQPPLLPDQVAGVREWVRTAWESAWHPPPPQCADGYRHMYLGTTERTLVLEKLRVVDGIALGAIQDLLEQLDELDSELRKVQGRIAQQQGVDDKFREINAELERLNGEIAELDSRTRELNRGRDGDRALLQNAKQKLASLLEGHQRAQPQLARAALADKVADMIEEVIKESYPLHIDNVAKEMTGVFRQLAHKSLLREVQIDPACNVRLLGDAGRDMRDMDASAGENQIFALSLIAAIARVSQRQFPMVMDTPLARLDREHRLNVLKYFTGRSGGEQVILLSQPDEVHGPYLDVIRNRVSVSYRIDHEEIGNGVGRSSVRRGYFEEV